MQRSPLSMPFLFQLQAADAMSVTNIAERMCGTYGKSDLVQVMCRCLLLFPGKIIRNVSAGHRIACM